MTTEQVTAELEQAIREKHAVTLSLGHRPFLADPLSLRQEDGKLVLTYWHAGNERPEKHMVTLVKEVVDLGRSLEQVRASEV